PQSRLGIVASCVHEPLAVGREHGTHGATVDIGLWKELAGLAVVDRQLPQGILEIVAEAAAMPRNPDVARIFPERGAECLHGRRHVWSPLHPQPGRSGTHL